MAVWYVVPCDLSFLLRLLSVVWLLVSLCAGLYSSLWLYPLFLSASWYGFVAWLNMFLFDEIADNQHQPKIISDLITVRLTENTFKTRYNGHTSSFRNEQYRNATTLSNYIWRLKDKNINYSLKWNIIDRGRAY